MREPGLIPNYFPFDTRSNAVLNKISITALKNNPAKGCKTKQITLHEYRLFPVAMAKKLFRKKRRILPCQMQDHDLYRESQADKFLLVTDKWLRPAPCL